MCSILTSRDLHFHFAARHEAGSAFYGARHPARWRLFLFSLLFGGITQANVISRLIKTHAGPLLIAFYVPVPFSSGTARHCRSSPRTTGKQRQTNSFPKNLVLNALNRLINRFSAHYVHRVLNAAVSGQFMWCLRILVLHVLNCFNPIS